MAKPRNGDIGRGIPRLILLAALGIGSLLASAETKGPAGRPLVEKQPLVENQPSATGRPAAESTSVAATGVAAEEALFAEIPMVEAATLHAQTLEEAPASVTVITAAEIRTHGYRTLGEALGSVRGFYMSNDRMYDYAGVRGFSIPGDFNSRFLIMINGHSLTENIYNSTNFFGQDFGLDMDLVERIEVIRGPNAALFGSNGMLATINIVTKSPVDHPAFRASVETGSFGERKAMLSTSVDLGRGANLLLSLSAFNNRGRDLYYPDFDNGEEGGGIANRVDAQKGYHSFANLSWGRWNFTGYFNSREILVPAGGGGTVLNSEGQFTRDSRNFVGLDYTRSVGKAARIRWDLKYDQYRYNDRWGYPLEDGGIQDNRTGNWGDWVNSQFTYSVPLRRVGTLTLGAQANVEMRNLQVNDDVSPEPVRYLNVSARDRIGALFAQQEWKISSRLTAYLGLRFDQSRNYGAFASPRLALVYQPSAKTAYKLVYGRPFRNPSAFERFYEDGLAYVANPDLTRETAQALEFSVERKLGANLTGLVNVYDYRLQNVIQAQWISDELIEYQNTGMRRSQGVEFELRGRPVWWLEATGSYVRQAASNPDLEQHLPNSPRSIAKGRAAVPLLRNRLYLSSQVQYLSSRETRSGLGLRPATLADLTISTRRLFQGYDLVGGMRNALNWQYDHPVDLSVEQIRANGRTLFVKLIWQSSE
ncbi:MAG: TonB-dependent receptor [Bryobacterales bacterium]|nr:TonB-dependent receptor [Bryobacterales bacterium]